MATLKDRGKKPIDAVLLDMDGTLLNSIETAERVWSAWAASHGIDIETFLPTIHGVQSVETIRRLGLANVDPEKEAEAIVQAELDDVEGIEAIAGAAEFLAALAGQPWAVVTSATRELALRRLRAAGLPWPPLLISAEDVFHGKPAPDCFRLAAERLGTTADRCLVLEDSPAGLKAAESAGATVLVVTATHRRPMETQQPVIFDYRELEIVRFPDGAVGISHAGDCSGVMPTISCLLQSSESEPISEDCRC